MATNGDKWRQMATNGRRMGRTAVIGAAMMLMAGATGTAIAQDDPPASPLPWENLTETAHYMSFEPEDSNWTFYPVISADSSFVGFFGYLPDEFIIGDNVSLLWAVPDKGDGSWSMYGWSHTDIKQVSSYLDNLTNTINVLGDTGLDVFTGDTVSMTQPKSMTNGIADDDPAAPIIQITQDPTIANALITAGVQGAPILAQKTLEATVGIIGGGCDQAIKADGESFSKFDAQMALYARTVQESMTVWLSDGLLDSLEKTGMDQDSQALRLCWPCFPGCVDVWGPWTPWSCVNPNPFRNGAGGCSCKRCTRSRSGSEICVDVFCNATSTTPIGPDRQGPTIITWIVDSATGQCLPCP